MEDECDGAVVHEDKDEDESPRGKVVPLSSKKFKSTQGVHGADKPSGSKSHTFLYKVSGGSLWTQKAKVHMSTSNPSAAAVNA